MWVTVQTDNGPVEVCVTQLSILPEDPDQWSPPYASGWVTREDPTTPVYDPDLSQQISDQGLLGRVLADWANMEKIAAGG